MKKTNLIIIAVIGGLILLGIGFGLGLSSGQKAVKKAMEEAKAPLAGLLESKVVRSLDAVASGEVTEISGHNLSLSNGGDALTISIKEDASIARLLPPEGEATETPQPPVREEIKFGEIKLGDQVSISCGLKADGSLEGIDIMVLVQG
jgi:hypothetical protein